MNPGDEDAELRDRLERAAKLVEGLPDDIRPVAFSKAYDHLSDGEISKKSSNRKSKGGRSSKRKAERAASGGAGTGKAQSGKTTGRRSGARTGAQAALQQLIAEGFFQTKRALPQVQDFLRSKRVLSFKQSELSSPLAVLTRRGELEREQNEEGVFEYWTEGK